MKIDPITFTAKFGNRVSPELTKGQYKLAALLLQKYPECASAETLVKTFGVKRNHIKVLMCQLRQKLKKIGVNVALTNGQASFQFLPANIRKELLKDGNSSKRKTNSAKEISAN